MLDLDEILKIVAPWDHAILQNGVKYPTRPPTFGEMIALSQIQNRPPDELRKMIASFFGEAKPPIERWKPEQVQAFLADYDRAIGEFSRKNSLAVVAMVNAPTATPSA